MKHGAYFLALALCASAIAQTSGGGGTSSGSSSGTGSASFISDFSSVTSPKLAACLGNVKSGVGNCRILMVGDSTTQGTGCNGSTTGNQQPCAWPTQLVAYLNANAIPAQNEAFFGNGSSSETNCVDNGKVNCGAWQDGGFTTVGGELFAGAVGAPLTFTPSTPCDSFRIWYTTFPSNAAFTVTIDSGTPTMITPTASSGLASSVVTGALGMHVISLNLPAAGSTFVVGIEAWNSTVPSVHILNAGWASSNLANWNDPDGGTGGFVQWAPLNAVPLMAPDVVMVDLGINDWRVSTDVADWKTSYQSLVTAWLVNSDFVIKTPVPSSLTVTTAANMNNYVTAMNQLSTTNSLGEIDTYSAFSTWTLANARAWMFDVLHPDFAGYTAVSQLVGTAIQKVSGVH